jgi:hypothetical protein
MKIKVQFGEWSFLYFSFTKYEDGSNDSNISASTAEWLSKPCDYFLVKAIFHKLKNCSSSTINDELISAFRMMLEFPAAVQSYRQS